jgi:hypothetical protein
VTGNHTVLLVRLEAMRTQPLLEFVERPQGRNLDNNVDILGWPNGRGARVCDPKAYGGTAQKNHLAQQVVERRRGELQQLDAHAGDLRSRSVSSSAASPRTLASPNRMASIRARR